MCDRDSSRGEKIGHACVSILRILEGQDQQI
jgi:hypothetical protein